MDEVNDAGGRVGIISTRGFLGCFKPCVHHTNSLAQRPVNARHLSKKATGYMIQG